jgi:diacylglycerol kinase
MNEKGFSLVKRIKSLSHAGRGVFILIKTTHNSWIAIASMVVTVSFGLYFDITKTEWMMVVFACGLVFMAEAFNTAIEIDMNLTSPEFHPYARDTKDVAAGAVLISLLTALIIGIFIFGPYII